MSILVTFAGRYGSTAEIAEAIAATLREQGCAVVVRPIVDIATLEGYDAVVIGSAVNYGAWLPLAVEFVRAHAAALRRVPVALFTVHIQNTDDKAESRRARLAYLDDVRPHVSAVSEAFFAGRFNRQAAPELIPGWLARFMPSFDHRQWPQIRAWAAGLPALLSVQNQMQGEHYVPNSA